MHLISSTLLIFYSCYGFYAFTIVPTRNIIICLCSSRVRCAHLVLSASARIVFATSQSAAQPADAEPHARPPRSKFTVHGRATGVRRRLRAKVNYAFGHEPRGGRTPHAAPRCVMDSTGDIRM